MRPRQGFDGDRRGWRRQAIAAGAGKFAIGQMLVDWAARAAVPVAIAAALISAAFPGQVFAQAPATISKSFSPSTVELGGDSSMTVTVTNPNVTPLTNVQFSDTMPAGIDLITQIGGTCSTPATGGGMFSINPGAETFSSTSTVLAGGQSCNIIVRVRGASVGIFTNTTSTVTSAEAGPGGPASANLQVNAASTATTLVSSVNPSTVGQSVTFTATVTSASGVPTGTVTFFDGGTAIGTATLTAGAASFTTSTLLAGTHVITARYGGSAGFPASNSSALTQIVQVPPDSARLRALQLAVTKVEALASGDAFAGAVAGAIADGFSEGGGQLITPSGNGLRFNFAADPDAAGATAGHVADRYDPVIAARAGAMRESALGQDGSGQGGLPAGLRSFAGEPATTSARVDDAFAGLAYARPAVTKAPAPRQAPKEWQLWADIRGTGWDTDASAGGIRGGQTNALVGLTRKLTPNFLVGVLGGYENFAYASHTLNGNLKGDGWTVGGYLGWRLWPGARFDAGLAYSGISYSGVSGAAAGSFPGHRWLATAGLTGTYRMQMLEIEPSAKVYAVWEHDDAYLDSLGTQQAENRFSTGRASSGVKVAYPMAWDVATTFAPYVGLYADYYFSSDNAAPLLPTQFVQGSAARVTAGLSYSGAGGAKVSIGGEVGGLGSQEFTTWSVRGRASVPF
jgi:uncharacterized repeat protein (TIGR01451 family)